MIMAYCPLSDLKSGLLGRTLFPAASSFTNPYTLTSFRDFDFSGLTTSASTWMQTGNNPSIAFCPGINGFWPLHNSTWEYPRIETVNSTGPKACATGTFIGNERPTLAINTLADFMNALLKALGFETEVFRAVERKSPIMHSASKRSVDDLFDDILNSPVIVGRAVATASSTSDFLLSYSLQCIISSEIGSSDVMLLLLLSISK